MRLAALKVADFFDVVVAFDDTQTHKPAPLPFEVALGRLGLKPEEVMMVGDNRERDVLGARKLGIRTIHAAYGMPKNVTNNYSYGDDSIQADFVLQDFHGILEIPDVKQFIENTTRREEVYNPVKFL